MEEEEALLAPEKLSSSSASRKPQIFGLVAAAIILVGTIIGVTLMIKLHPLDQDNTNVAMYNFTVTRDFIVLSDGTQLAVTYAIPVAQTEDEKFPVLFEYLPYRKDDSFLYRDCPYFAYFASRGFVVAKVDIRGTGSSFGKLIHREYTNQELDDGAEIINQLAKMPWSNGNVGMFGISWGAFNALMMATYRKPEPLKAIYVVHGSHDLYGIDIHYPDGILHFDEYILSVVHEDALPQSLEYLLNSNYTNDRLQTIPWSDIYLNHSIDSFFWQEHSIMYNFSALTIPTYLVGGFYDTYVDFAPIIYQNIRNQTKARVAIGPWNHAWPEQGTPGPNYDGKREAVRWFNAHLRDQDDGILSEPEFNVFIRESYAPDIDIEPVPGYWISEEWPVSETLWTRYWLDANQSLTSSGVPPDVNIQTMTYKPSAGQLSEAWPQQLVGNQIPADQNDGALVYASQPFNEPTEMLGFGRISLNVSATAPQANWFIKLEDIDPTGTNATLVASTAFNGNQRSGRTTPSDIIPGEYFTINTTFHFSSWVFPKGHRVRIAIVNSAMKRAWPSPYSMTTSIVLGGVSPSYIELPFVTISSDKANSPPHFTQIAYSPPPKCDYADDYSSSLEVDHGESSPSGAWSYVASGTGYRTFDNNWVAYLSQNFTVPDNSQPEQFIWNGFAVSLVAFNTSTGAQTNGSNSFLDAVKSLDSTFSKQLTNTGVANSSEIPDVDLNSVSWMKLETINTVTSNFTHFTSYVSRKIYSNGTLWSNFESTLTFPRKWQ